MKKLICLIAILLLLTVPSCAAYARSAYQQFWEPGTYSVTLTDEEKQRYAEVWEKTLARSEGTLIREAFERDSLEENLELYLEMIENGPLPLMHLDDLGDYVYSCGLPDDLAIAQTDALLIAYKVLQERYPLTDEELTQFLPFYSYLTSDPENPAWDIAFSSYDPSLELSFVVSLYAYDGSVRGLTKNTESHG